MRLKAGDWLWVTLSTALGLLTIWTVVTVAIVQWGE